MSPQTAPLMFLPSHLKSMVASPRAAGHPDGQGHRDLVAPEADRGLAGLELSRHLVDDHVQVVLADGDDLLDRARLVDLEVRERQGDGVDEAAEHPLHQRARERGGNADPHPACRACPPGAGPSPPSRSGGLGARRARAPAPRSAPSSAPGCRASLRRQPVPAASAISAERRREEAPPSLRLPPSGTGTASLDQLTGHHVDGDPQHALAGEDVGDAHRERHRGPLQAHRAVA